MNQSIFILCRKVGPQALTLCQLFQELGLNVKIVPDEWNDENPLPEEIRMGDDLLLGYEFMNAGIAKPKPYTAWERAIYYILQNLSEDQRVWLIEDDVAVQKDSFLSLQSLTLAYGADFATRDIMPQQLSSDWYWWDQVNFHHTQPHNSFNPLCYCSYKHLLALKNYREKHGSLGFLEIFMPSIAVDENLTILDWSSNPETSACFGEYSHRPEVTIAQWGICHPVKNAIVFDEISVSSQPLRNRSILALPWLDELKNSLNKSDEYYTWVTNPKVWCDCDNKEFFSSFNQCNADFLATNLRTREDDPAWYHWGTFTPVKQMLGSTTQDSVVGSLYLMRLSRPAAEYLLACDFRVLSQDPQSAKDLIVCTPLANEHTGVIHGQYSGHIEAVIPTLLQNAGFLLEDIGGKSRFTPKNRVGQWYDQDTWSWQSPIRFKPGMIHHPAEQKKVNLSPKRFATHVEDQYRILFFSPIGAYAKPYLSTWLQMCKKSGADAYFVQYDQDDELEGLVQAHDGCESVFTLQRGSKWQLVINHIKPELVAKYDYLCLWDDDLAAMDFDLQRFVKIMAANRLDMAQPAILSPHPLSHQITGVHPLEAPVLTSTGIEMDVVGRLTNFVEIMVPFFSREGWSEFSSYVDPANLSGYGYDYIPLGRKGIIDVMPVIHTRAVQSFKEQSFKEWDDFMTQQGLLKHAHLNIGSLYEKADPLAPSFHEGFLRSYHDS